MLPDGRRAEVTVETAGESTEETDVLELVRDSWRKLGIALFSRPSVREVFRKRVYSGKSMMTRLRFCAVALRSLSARIVIGSGPAIS